LELVSGGSSSSTGFGVLLPFSPPAPDRAWWAHKVLRMKAAVALSERKSEVGLLASRLWGPVEAGREISIGFASPGSFALLGWSRDGSSACVVLGVSWFMASGLALPGGCPVPIHITGMCRSSNCGMQSSINLMRWSGSFVADLHVSLPRDGSRYQRAASTNIYLSIHRTQLYLRQ
jgi:hypothetical protein